MVTADGPGITTKGRPFFMTVFTSKYPGSEIKGVPDSDTKAIFFPSFNQSIISGSFSNSRSL